MHVSGTVVLLLGALQVARGARISRGLVGGGYGGASGGGSCKFWCEGGGGQYYCCQTPQQTALQQGGGHLPQTSGGGYGGQGVGNFGNNFGHHGAQTSGGYGTQGINNFGNNNFGHHGAGSNFGHHGSTGNNFAHQGNNFGSQGSYRPQVSHGNTGFRPTHGVNQGGGFRPTGYGSNNNNNLAALFNQVVNNAGSQGFQGNNNRPQGHSSNFVSNPSIVTPLGHNDAISTVGNNNFDPNSFAFQGGNHGGPTYPFDVRGILPKKS